MFDHVTIRVADRSASERGYDALLAALGRPRSATAEGLTEWGDFSLMPADAGSPPTRGLHVGFFAGSRADVEAGWRAGVAAGFADDGPPGPRPQYREDYHGAFLRDPDGNSAEAVHHGLTKRSGAIDHLWLRVADLAAARAFYATIGPYAGFALVRDEPGRAMFRGAAGSLSLVEGEPTEHAHLAFPAPDRATVVAFHRSAIEAGYRDHGAPGERPRCHPGYFAAYVLDPDGHNVELVDHGRGFLSAAGRQRRACR